MSARLTLFATPSLPRLRRHSSAVSPPRERRVRSLIRHLQCLDFLFCIFFDPQPQYSISLCLFLFAPTPSQDFPGLQRMAMKEKKKTVDGSSDIHTPYPARHSKMTILLGMKGKTVVCFVLDLVILELCTKLQNAAFDIRNVRDFVVLRQPTIFMCIRIN